MQQLRRSHRRGRDGGRGRRRARRRHHACSTPPTSTAAAIRRSSSDALLGSHRAEVIVATKFAMPMGDGPYAAGGSRRYVMRARRGEPAAARHRLHRPVPDARARPDDTDRGDARGAHRSGAPGQGALPRLVELQRLADRRRRLDLARPVASRVSCPRRTSGACCGGRWSARSCPRASSSARACCRTSRSRAARSPASTGGANPRRRAPGSSADSGTPLAHRRQLRPHRGARRSSRREHGHTVGELALAWLASQRVVCSVIAGATRPEQVRQNVAALEWRLSRDDRTRSTRSSRRRSPQRLSGVRGTDAGAAAARTRA